jgi:hypothetical protein
MMLAMLVTVWLVASLAAALFAGRFIYEGEKPDTPSGDRPGKI